MWKIDGVIMMGSIIVVVVYLLNGLRKDYMKLKGKREDYEEGERAGE